MTETYKVQMLEPSRSPDLEDIWVDLTFPTGKEQTDNPNYARTFLCEERTLKSHRKYRLVKVTTDVLLQS